MYLRVYIFIYFHFNSVFPLDRDFFDAYYLGNKPREVHPRGPHSLRSGILSPVSMLTGPITLRWWIISEG